MTRFIRDAALVQGDELVLAQEDERYCVSYRRKREGRGLESGMLKLGNGWRVIDID